MRIGHLGCHVKAKVFVVIDIGITQAYQHATTSDKSLKIKLVKWLDLIDKRRQTVLRFCITKSLIKRRLKLSRKSRARTQNET